MTDVEILRAAENIIRRATPGSDHEREVFRDTITGLVWARTDIMIAAYEMANEGATLLWHATR